jgi:ubiquinone/menaquinone biosynthesis C-methylase UbiE
MKMKTPISRHHLSIENSASVLEVGGGHNPHKRSNVVVDKFIDVNYHRSGDIKVHKHQKFLAADGENLPFVENEFDYVICNQVLEHVENPEKFLTEQMRVARAGYIEVPSLVGEYLFPKESHKWLILEIENKLVLMDKELVGFKPSHDLGDVFLHYLPTKSLGYKIMQYTHGNIETIRYEWSDEIEFLVNPKEEKYRRYFTQTWDVETASKFFPKRTLASELWEASKAFAFVLLNVFKSRVLKVA